MRASRPEMIFPRRSVVLCALLAAALPAFGQVTGAISGSVVDSATQAGVAGAVVTASSPALQGEQTAQTDERGEFQLVLLAPGAYSLSVQRDGYQPSTREGLTVQLDRTLRVRLDIVADGAAAAALFVLPPPPSRIALPGTQTGGVVSREQMELLPYGRDTRSIEQAALAVPGVLFDPFGLSVRGSQSLESRILVDGVDTTDPAFNRQGSRLLQNFVQEISVDDAGYQARYGRSAGGIVNVLTRSGGNEFHGSAFLDVLPLEASRKDLPATGATIRGRESLRYDVDGGFELGGPILRDRLWFHAGLAPQIVSHDVERVVHSGGTTVAAGAYSSTQSEFQYAGKLTFRAAEDHALILSFSGNPGSTSGVMAGPSDLDAALNGNESAFLGRGTSGATDLSLRYQGRVLDRRLLLQAALFWHHAGFSLSPASTGAVSAQQIGDTPSVIWSPSLNLLDPRLVDASTPLVQTDTAVAQACAPTAANPRPCPVTLYATGGLIPQDFSTDRLGASLEAGHFAELFGQHRFRYGLELARDGYDITRTLPGGMQAVVLPDGRLAVNAFGQRDPQNPSQPARDANGNLLGTTASTGTHQWTTAAYAQDTWKLADNFWLDAGLRLERQRMFASQGSQVGALGGGTLQAFQLTSLMPRLGLSYDFTGRGLSRAYAFFGRFYESLPLELADLGLSGHPTLQYVADGTRCGASTTFTSLDPRRCPAVSPFAFGGTGSAVLVDSAIRGSYNDQYSAGAQVQVLRNVVAGLDYSHRVLGRAVEDVSSTGLPGGARVLTNPGEASRIYDGVTLSVARPFAQGYFLEASYTLSSWRGNYSGPFRAEDLAAPPHLTGEFDFTSQAANRNGPLPGGAPQVFKLDGAYAYEYSPSTTFTFGAVFRAIQGMPLSYLARDPAAPASGDTASFVLPRGSAGRLPWQTTLDLRGGFTYALSASYALSVTLDLLNVLNGQSATEVDQRYSLDPSGVAPQPAGTPLGSIRNGAGQPVTVNPAFLAARAYTDPLAARLGMRLSF